MKTEVEFIEVTNKLQNALIVTDMYENSFKNKSLKEVIAELKKYAEIALEILKILAKYFFVNGKIAPPAIWKVWIYFRLVKELFDLFKEIKNADSNN